MEYHSPNAFFEALNCHFHRQKWQCKKGVPRTLQVTFFLGGLSSWQKWRSKHQNSAISREFLQ